MSRFLWVFKALAIGFISLLLLVPLGMIQGTVAERQRYRQQAVQSVARSHAGEQQLQAPVVVLPYRIERTVTRVDDRGLPRTDVLVEDRQWLFFPRKVDLRGQLQPSVKRRGLHQVRIYELAAKLEGGFDFTVPASVADGVVKSVSAPYLSLGISDVRGLQGLPGATLAGRALPFAQGAAPGGTGSGLHVVLDAVQPGERRQFDFTLQLALGGTERFAFLPLADSNHVELASSWPHPSFDGDYSPRQPTINGQGFKAGWDITALSSSAQADYLARGGRGPVAVEPGDGAASAVSGAGLAVTLVDPVNIYTQADRASKYGFLFVLLTFVGFLMFELVKRLAIHPIQYGLVGLALAIFFLLMLSLSEHIPFWQAYLAASAACIALLGVYLSAVLRSRMRGAAFAAMLTLLYATLYGLLVSEDNALVLGSLMLFAILAAIMLATRRIDWYALSSAAPPAVPAKAGETA
jgi:inner membrane protein